MAFQKSFFKGSRLFSSEQEQTGTLHCYCYPGLGWKTVTTLSLSLGLAGLGRKESSLHAKAATVGPSGS